MKVLELFGLNQVPNEFKNIFYNFYHTLSISKLKIILGRSKLFWLVNSAVVLAQIYFGLIEGQILRILADY